MFVTRLVPKNDSEDYVVPNLDMTNTQSDEGRFEFAAVGIEPEMHRNVVVTTQGQPITGVAFPRKDSIGDPGMSFEAFVSYGPIVAGELMIARTVKLVSHTISSVVEELWSTHVASKYFNSSDWGVSFSIINTGTGAPLDAKIVMVLYS